MIDAQDRAIINALQGGFPIADRPFAEAADTLGIDEETLIERIGTLREAGVLTRFGPMYNAEEMGGAFCLCAVAAPQDRFDETVASINAYDEVAHNYARDHELNIWFVLATESTEQIDEINASIEADTGLKVYAFPKLHEFFIGLKVDA